MVHKPAQITQENPALQVKLQEARNLWAKRVKWTQDTYTFDELLKFFRDGSLSFENIGVHLGVSRQRIWQLYTKYFKEFCDSTIRSKEAKVNKKKQEYKERLFKEDEVIRTIRTRVNELGHTIEPVYRRWAGAMCSKVIINGYLCSIRVIKNRFTPSKRTKRVYNHVSILRKTVQKVSFVIVCVEESNAIVRIFVLPSSILLAQFSGNEISVYTPIEKLPPYNNSRPRINYWEYEGAWHLLKKKM